MKNAHLRFGTMLFHKSAGKLTNSFRLHMDRFIGERVTGEECRAHFLSVIGGDAQIAAARAIIADEQSFTVEGPGLSSVNAKLGKDAQCFRASIPLSSSKRQLRHLIAVSQEFGTMGQSLTGGRTLLAQSSPDYVWSSMAHIFGLPAVPEWADWFYKKLDDNLAITRIHGLGFNPVLVTGTKEEFLRWLSEGIKKAEIEFPQSNGPAVWPEIPLQRILLPDSNAHFENDRFLN